MLIDSAGKRFEIPPEGRHVAVLADIYSIGTRPTKFGPKEQVCFRWLLEITNSTGHRYSTFQSNAGREFVSPIGSGNVRWCASSQSRLRFGCLTKICCFYH